MHLFYATSPGTNHMKILRDNKAKNLLFSYAFVKKPQQLLDLLGDWTPEKIIIDSGAFSVWSNGGHIDLTEYAQFCKEFQAKLDPSIQLHITNLDVLPGKWSFVPTKKDIADSAVQGWENMLYLEKQGLKTIHVFHQHEDFEILDRLCKHLDYIGISPANDVSNNEKMSWMNKVFSHINKQYGLNKIKTHFFAGTGDRMLTDFPTYSADSSSWIAPARYGRVAVWTDNHRLKTFQYKVPEDVEKFWKYVSYMGIDKMASPRWEDRTSLSIRAYLDLEKFVTEVWRRRGIIWE